MKTAELTGAALDWFVLRCERPEWWEEGNDFRMSNDYSDLLMDDGEDFNPSTNWAQGGPIIEREGITIERFKGGPKWSAFLFQTGDCEIAADTPLIAAMRCYVASKLGDDVEIPEELK